MMPTSTKVQSGAVKIYKIDHGPKARIKTNNRQQLITTQQRNNYNLKAVQNILDSTWVASPEGHN